MIDSSAAAWWQLHLRSNGFRFCSWVSIFLSSGGTIKCKIWVAGAILENPKDTTKVHLIYTNVTFEDTLLKVGQMIKMMHGTLYSFIFKSPKITATPSSGFLAGRKYKTEDRPSTSASTSS
ncbi:hypothetical protein F0562_027963 [Nyssa sinensis]|uniref:Uncharacterized protein n=1 Tax=Nyssa sinensis TaxID=561372 RepID=A0A5J5B6L0_9ASTE|nr:hypothetical protein F0562_027963 [Nyssa sinensis]